MDYANRIRYYHFMAGVLAGQQNDPLCNICRAFTNTVRALKESVAEFGDATAEDRALTGDLCSMLAEARNMLESLQTFPDAIGQKKAGHCMLPEGVCFVKTSKALAERIC